MSKAAARPSEVESVLATAQREPSPVYLLVGESFQTQGVAHRLIDVLVPPDRRSFNLEIYDGRVTSIGPVLDSLRMRGLFPGCKVVWVREPTLFLSGEKRSDVSESMFAAWAEERHEDAAQKLLTLVGMAGWTQDRFAQVEWAAVPAADTKELLGRAPTARDLSILESMRTHCRDQGLSVAAYRDESGILDHFLEQGVPPDSVLIFTAATVDRRKRVVKKIAQTGTLLELTVERERSGALSPASVDQLIEQILQAAGKRLAASGRRLIHARAGTDPAQLASEMEKLCLFVGAETGITEDDVRTSVRDLAESWIFDFTRALAQREPSSAVTLLRGLFEQGEPPLRIVAMIARELRLLLIARDCLSGPLAGKWNPRVPFAVFRDRLLPLLTEPQREALSGIHPFVLFLSLQNAGRVGTAALQGAVLALQQLDVKLKSGVGDARILLEAFVLDLCRSA